ncbi:phage tail protein [Acinetobacter sp. ANC 3832]|uniref:phage tail protein n=1 Tax=Acinetobacter sp. ANC 3832 TaxID=1977874 RepID=UPI000A350A67|nr:phage tail protein [Acinetobacter sp. ANC 3832]OTG94988.1 phage tail protein [Acinetobacter sp. ANC 3832]
MANEVEVKITASTDALSDGMNEATNKVQSAAADINRIADTIKNAFDGVRDSLKNIDVSLNIDMSDVQQKLSNAANTIKSRINSIVDEASIKLKIDTTALDSEIGHAENLIRSRLSSLPIQNVRLDIDIHEIQRRLNQINNQQIKVKLGIDLSQLRSELQQAKQTVSTTLQSVFSNAIRITVNLPLLSAQLNQARTMIQSAISRLQHTNINLNTVINVDATSTMLRGSLDRLKTSIDHLRTRINSGGGGGGGSGGGGSGRDGSGSGGGSGSGIGTSLVGNFLANMASQLVSQIGALTGEVIRNAREIENMSRLANATTKEFQEWGFASKSVGISQEKLGDIMKDVNDKFGDFMQTGGGEMADFFEKIAPKVGITAKEFQGLSGPQILGKYYETLKKANVSQAEMTFYMESIANDAMLLSPLLDDNAKKLKEYSKQAHDLGVILDDEAIQATKDFDSSLGLIGATIKGLLGRLVAELAPGLKNMANNFLSSATKSKEAIDGSITAIITIFENLLDSTTGVMQLISDIWGDLTKDIGDGSVQQVGFMDMVTSALRVFAALTIGLRVAIQSAFAVIRAVVTTVCQALSFAISTVMNVFGGFRDTIQYGLDVLGVKFKTFGNVVSSVLSFDFSGAKAAYEQGFTELGSITDRYTSKMSTRLDWMKSDWQKSTVGITTAVNLMGQTIVDSATKGGQQLSDTFLGKLKENKPSPATSTTFDPNKGVGTGKKDEKKSGSHKESKYEPTSYSDLRIKSTEAYAGGKAHQGVLDLAGLIQDKFQITRFTAFNDKYHQGTSSKHAQGLAVDFGLQDKSKSGQVASDLKAMLGKNGVNAQVLDEYKNPSKRATGGHIHVSFNSQADADKYLALVKNDKVKGSKKSSSDSRYERYLEEQTRNAEKAEKERLDLKYKYASEQEKVQLELTKELDRIEKSTLNSADKKTFKEKAEKESQDKIVALNLEAFEKIKAIYEQEIQFKQDQAQRIYELEKAGIQAALDAGRISNVEKVQLDKQLEDQLYQIKRDGLLARLDLENQQSSISGKGAGQATISNNIAELDSQKKVSDTGAPKKLDEAQLADFEKKFGGLTSRMSNLWDQGMQAMMNGTLTWKNATNAIFSEVAMEFVQKMVTKPIQDYMSGLARRLAVKMGFIKAETAAEVMGQTAQTTAVVAGEGMKTAATSAGVFARLGLKLMEVIKSIMMSAWEAMAAAWAALSAIPFVGPALGVAAGIAAFAGVSAIVGKVASARGGYDIPSGVNPMTQLHEEEMVLPKQHANTIRALGKSMAGGELSQPTIPGDAGGMTTLNIQAWDSKDVKRFMKKHGRELAGGLKGYNRNFGK